MGFFFTCRGRVFLFTWRYQCLPAVHGVCVCGLVIFGLFGAAVAAATLERSVETRGHRTCCTCWNEFSAADDRKAIRCRTPPSVIDWQLFGWVSSESVYMFIRGAGGGVR